MARAPHAAMPTGAPTLLASFALTTVKATGAADVAALYCPRSLVTSAVALVVVHVALHVTVACAHKVKERRDVSEPCSEVA